MEPGRTKKSKPHEHSEGVVHNVHWVSVGLSLLLDLAGLGPFEVLLAAFGNILGTGATL